MPLHTAVRQARTLASLPLLLFVLLLSGCGRSEDKPAQPARPSASGNETPVVAAPVKPLVVGIFQIVEHPVCDAAREGFEEEMKKGGDIKGRPVRITLQNAHGDNALIDQIATKFVADRVDLVYVLGTPCAQAIASKTREIPIVLGGATDPVAAKMADSWEKPGHNVTGTSDLPPVDAQFAMLKEILPKARRIGIIYNAGESNSVAVVDRAKRTAEKAGLALVLRSVTGTAEVPQAATSLVGNCDAIYIPTDNTTHAALPALMQAARAGNLPVFNCTEESVKEGALFALAVDYREIGRLSARMAQEILEGKNPAEMPIRLLDNPSLVLNLDSAEALSVNLSEAVRKRASKTFGGGSKGGK